MKKILLPLFMAVVFTVAISAQDAKKDCPQPAKKECCKKDAKKEGCSKDAKKGCCKKDAKKGCASKK